MTAGSLVRDEIADPADITVYAASIGHSVWFSEDLGGSWARAATATGGIYNESRCWSLSTSADRPGEVLAGTDQGLYRWSPQLSRWTYVPSPLDDLHILQVAQSPFDADVIVAGTRPAEVFRSLDGGATWDRCALGNATECPEINTPRVTSIRFDPRDRNTVWVTIEIDAIYRSRDLGETWERLSTGLLTDDVHNIVIIDEPSPRRIFVSTELGLHRSNDDGETFSPVPVADAPWPYCRALTRRADLGGVLFATFGDRPSGVASMLVRSRDHGESWHAVELPDEPNSTLWSIATNPADPNLIFMCTIMGQMFRSTDGGESWTRLPRQLGELRMMAWQATGGSHPSRVRSTHAAASV